MSDDEKLVAIMAEYYNEMRWRRDSERSLLALLVGMWISFFVAASAAMDLDSAGATWAVLIVMGLVGAAASLVVSLKVSSEHSHYAALGDKVSGIIQTLGVDAKHVPGDGEKFGHGAGFRETIGIIWMLVLVYAIAAIVFGCNAT